MKIIRDIFKPVAILSGLFSLAGCASTIAKAVHPFVENSSVPVWKVSVESHGSPYSGNWTTRLNASGDSNTVEPSSMPQPFVEIQHNNWKLDFELIYRQHENNKSELTKGEYEAWEKDVDLAYNLTQYLLEGTPPPIDAKIFLVPPKLGYSNSWITKSESAIPVRYAFYYSADGASSDTRENALQRSEGMAALGYLIQRFTFSDQVTAGQNLGDSAALKSEANSLCWFLAVRPALSEGQDIRIKSGANLPMAESTISVLRANYRAHLDSNVAAKMYATSLLFKEVGAYLEYRHLDWPERGTDKAGLNAVLRSCRALVHYPGSIEGGHVPFELIDRQPDYFK